MFPRLTVIVCNYHHLDRRQWRSETFNAHVTQGDVMSQWCEIMSGGFTHILTYTHTHTCTDFLLHILTYTNLHVGSHHTHWRPVAEWSKPEPRLSRSWYPSPILSVPAPRFQTHISPCGRTFSQGQTIKSSDDSTKHSSPGSPTTTGWALFPKRGSVAERERERERKREVCVLEESIKSSCVEHRLGA